MCQSVISLTQNIKVILAFACGFIHVMSVFRMLFKVKLLESRTIMNHKNHLQLAKTHVFNSVMEICNFYFKDRMKFSFGFCVHYIFYFSESSCWLLLCSSTLANFFFLNIDIKPEDLRAFVPMGAGVELEKTKRDRER